MNYFNLLGIFLKTVKSAQMPVKEQDMTNYEGNNKELSLNPINMLNFILVDQYETITPCFMFVIGKLGVKYNGIGASTFEISDTDNFFDYETYHAGANYQKYRNKILSEMKHQFIINYDLFNACRIHDSNWVLILDGHPLYDPSIATFYNRNCKDEDLIYYLYFRLIGSSYNFAIIHKSAEVKKLFCWSGLVIIGKDTKIGYDVCLKNGVLISSGCIIGDYVSIGSHTIIGYGTLVFSCIDVGEKNIIGNDVIIHRDVCPISKNVLHVQQAKNNPYAAHTKYQDLLYLGNFNIFFSETKWQVRFKPVSFWVECSNFHM